MYDLNIEWLEWCFASLPYIPIFSQELPSCLISGRAAAAAAVARRATATSCSGTVQTAGPRLSAGPSCYPRSPSWQSDGFWGEWANWKIHLPCPGQLVWICWSVLIIFCVPTSAVARARVGTFEPPSQIHMFYQNHLKWHNGKDTISQHFPDDFLWNGLLLSESAAGASCDK